MRSGCRATWAVGATGARTCSTARRCRRRPASRDSRSPDSPPWRSSRRPSELAERYPGYDVLAKRDSPSWNEKTRRVIEERMAIGADRHTFFTDTEWPTIRAVCARVLAQHDGQGEGKAQGSSQCNGQSVEVPLAAM